MFRSTARLLFPLVITLLVTACSGVGFGFGKTDEVVDKDGNSVPVTEAEVALPAFPKRENLMRFPTDWTSNEIYIDVSTLAIGNDIISYTLLVRGAGGANNYSFESIRCNGARRVLAYGKNDGTWSPARSTAWQPIGDSRSNRYYFEFWRDIFCNGDVLFPKRQIIANLKRGGGEVQYTTPGE